MTRLKKVLGRSVIIALAAPEQNIGNLVIRAGSSERWEKIWKGQVVAMGDEAREELGLVGEGDIVWFDKFGLTDIPSLNSSAEERIIHLTCENILLVESLPAKKSRKKSRKNSKKKGE